jgi:aldehyde dehydrogenase (NAD+)
LIVTDDVHDEVVRRIVARLEALKVGPALDPATQIGPVVDARQLAVDQDYIRIGQAEGARLAVGGERVPCATEGFYLSPALFVDTDPAMRINREEIFGPVASVQRARDYEHALQLANDTQFGLSSGICTSSLKYATHFQRYAQAGLVMVNAPTAGIDYHVPFGGTKGSSYGSREQGSFAAEFYTKVKTAYVAA